MYIYPDHLKSKATLWLWQLRDIGILGICGLVSILAATQAGFMFPCVLTGVYGFLTIRFEDTSILDFIRYACAYFFMRQQFLSGGMNEQGETKAKKRQRSASPHGSSLVQRRLQTTVW